MQKLVERRKGTDYFFILGAILLVVYRQVVIKWQVSDAGGAPDDAMGRALFFLSFLLNPWIVTVFVAAFLATLCWMMALGRFELSHAYPFMSSSYIIVLGASAIIFHEAATMPKILGVIFIVAGCFVGSRR